MHDEIKNGTIINKFGYCGYGFEQDAYGNYVHIYNLFVFPKFRKQGKARDILQAAIDAIRKIGYKGIIQIVADPEKNCVSLEKLSSFYKRMGLEVFSYYG